MKPLNEPVLDDNYPVYAGYFYVADDNVIISPVKGNVAQLKQSISATEIRRCDAVARGML